MKQIEGYENYYATVNGEIISTKLEKEKVLKQQNNGNGYLTVTLSKNGKVKSYYVHRLVAKAFLENKDNKDEVNHIDGKRSNNNLNNLEWVTRSENHYHRYKVLKQRGVNYGKTGAKNWKSKPVIKLSSTGDFIEKYPGVMEASRQTNINEANIRSCIYGKQKTAGGFNWKYDIRGKKARW